MTADHPSSSGPVTATVTLVLGGTRSGKSAAAEKIAADHAGVRGAAVTYLATARVSDEAMAARVAIHRARRPPEWTTLEAGGPDLPAVLAGRPGVVLLDSLGTWLASSPELSVDEEGLVAALRSRPGPTVVVSEEVGLSVHPPTELGRRFVDALGTLNQAVAAIATRVVLVVAGRQLEL